MVVLNPRGDIRIAVKLEGFAGLPTGIEDAEIDVRTDSGLAGTAGEPGLHVAGGTDRALLVEDRNNGERVLKTDGFPEVLNDLGHVQRVEDAATDFVLAEERRRDDDVAAGKIFFGEANDLRQEKFAIGFPIGLHQVVDFGGGLEYDTLHALFSAKFFDINAGQFRDVRFTVDDGSKVGDGWRFVGIESQGFGL